MGWDPWEHVDDVEILIGPCPVPGLYFPADGVIVIDVGGTEVMRRSALAEELAHHELGHWPHQRRDEVARMEQRARRWASRRIIETGELVEAIIDATTWVEVAERLAVDPELLEFRINDMDEEERHNVWRAVGTRELGL